MEPLAEKLMDEYFDAQTGQSLRSAFKRHHAASGSDRR